MKKTLLVIVMALVLSFVSVKSYAGFIDYCQREGQTNQLQISNDLMKENNKLLKDILVELKEINKSQRNNLLTINQ